MNLFLGTQNKIAFRPLVLVSTIFLLSAMTGCSSSESNEGIPPAPNNSSFDIPKPRADLGGPLEISKRPADIALCTKLKTTINNSNFSNARWGIVVIGLSDGRVSCGMDARKLFNPASIQKLLTSIVALDRLGAGFRWKTSVYGKGEIDNGSLEGDLILYGRGAPDFDDKDVQKIAGDLKAAGVKQIKGDIVGDESYFKGDNLGDGWTWNAAQWYYGAAASAITINKNQITVSLQNGKPKTDSRFVDLSGEVSPVDDIEAIGVKRELGTNKVYVWGNGKSLNARLAISKPALFAAKILKEALEQNGIAISGSARSVDWRSKEKAVVENLNELSSVQSQTLGEIINEMNKDSVNLYAELILRTLGKKFGDEAPDENPKMQKLRGDDSAGASLIKKWFADKNIAVYEIAVHDGSGLSRLNFVTPEAIGRALVYSAQAEFSKTLRESLPVSGRSGTLGNRLKNVSGRVLGKTGSVTYVNSLAGYAQSASDVYSFAIIVNNSTRKKGASELIDQLMVHIVQSTGN